MFLTVPATKVLQTLETKIQKQVLKLKILKSFQIEAFFNDFCQRTKLGKDLKIQQFLAKPSIGTYKE
jgi:hypothetical protein